MCLSRISRMSKPPSPIIRLSKGGQNAGLPSSAAAGGGANPASTGAKNKKQCNGARSCNDFHCPRITNGEGHAEGYTRPTECWHFLNNPKGCRICGKQQSENCSDFYGCPILDCKLKHDPKRTLRLRENEFPSLGGESAVPAVPVQSEKDSTVPAATFAKVAATPATGSTSNKVYGVPELQEAIGQLGIMNEGLEPNDRGPINNWIHLLMQMSIMNDLHPLSKNVGQTIDSALSFCRTYSDLQKKRYQDLHDQTSREKKNVLLDPRMFEIQTSASESTKTCMACASAWSLFHGQNQEHLTRFAMSLEPSHELNQSFIIDEFMKSFNFLNESAATSLIENLQLKSIQDFRAFVHKINEMFQRLEIQAELFLNQEECPEVDLSALTFFIHNFMDMNDDPNTRSIENVSELYIQFISSSGSFSGFFNKFENCFFNVNCEHFFDILVRVITQRLGKDNAEEFKTGLLSGDITEAFFTAHLLPLFEKSMDQTKRYLKRTDEAVLECMKSFIDMKDGFLTEDLINFLFSTFETGGNEGRLTIVKAIDNYLTVLMRYFGIVEDPINVPFGHKWVMNYKNLTGNKVSEDVSVLVGDYIFNLVCIAKFLVDNNKELSIRFGNCGVFSVRGGQKTVTPMSISFLFDEIGKRLADDQTFGFVKANKGASEKVPDVFCTKILNNKKLQNRSRGYIMKYFMDQSIQVMAERIFQETAERKSFFEKIEEIKQSFRVEDSEDPFLHLFLSMFKRNANDKFQMSIVEFLLHEPCKVALLDALSFVDPRFQMSESMKSTVSSVLRFSTTIPELKDNDVVSAVREAFNFIIQSGITLSEVLDICAVFKELYNANSTWMVFINTFGVALMAAASKTLGLKFETMYSIVTDCLNPIKGIVKKTESFNSSLRPDVSKLNRPSNNFFRSCVKPTQNCESFCSDATSSQVEHKDNIAKFKRMVYILFPFIMFSSIYHKSQKTDQMSLALSEIFDRMSMILIASNRTDVLQMLGLMEMDTLTEQRKKESHEEWFLRSVAPPLTTSTLSAYLDSMQRYLQENSKTIQELLGDVELKSLKAQFRMETQLQSLYHFLRMSGILTEENVTLLNEPEVHSTILTTTWRGRKVVDIDALSTTLSEKYNVSESFVKGIFSIIHLALYPDHNDIVARREIMNEIYANKMSLFDEQFGQRSCSVQGSSSSSQTISFADLAFGSPDLGLKELLSQFMRSVDGSIAKIIQQRIDELPVSLMSKKFLEVLSAGIPMNDVECMTEFAKEMLKGIEPSDFVSCFSSLNAYIETVFYDDEGVDLKQFREQLSDSSTELSRLFSSYVRASIADFESKE